MRGSIVIPAHDEAEVVGRCLESLLAEGVEDCEVVVVANGCSDATVAAAQGYRDRIPGLLVLETPEAGKIGALNLGDASVSSFPRLYLDADIELRNGALDALMTTLSADEEIVAAPRVHFDLHGAGWVSRAFHEVYARLPYVSRGLVGLGVYGISAGGRRRFGAFPDLIADDLFVQDLFAGSERVTTAGEFVVRAPRRARDLVRVRARSADGARELARRAPRRSTSGSRGTGRGLAALAAGKPWLLPQILTYVAVTLVARRVASRESGVWQRDDSTRTAPITREARPWPQVAIDGVPIDSLSEAEVVSHVGESIDRGQGGVIITANADQMRRLRTPAHAALVRDAALIVPDGVPLLWASNLMGRPLPGRVNGTNLLVRLCQAAAGRGDRVFLLGAGPGVAEEAAAALESSSPGLDVCGVHSPPLGFRDDPQEWGRTVARVVEARPHLVFVALGYPAQEEVGFRLSAHLPGAWFMGCGGALDLLSGRVNRAPVLFQRIGAEWLHRLSQEPRRLARRYLVDDAPYVLGMLYRARRAREDRPSSLAQPGSQR